MPSNNTSGFFLSICQKILNISSNSWVREFQPPLYTEDQHFSFLWSHIKSLLYHLHGMTGCNGCSLSWDVWNFFPSPLSCCNSNKSNQFHDLQFLLSPTHIQITQNDYKLIKPLINVFSANFKFSTWLFKQLIIKLWD